MGTTHIMYGSCILHLCIGRALAQLVHLDLELRLLLAERLLQCSDVLQRGAERRLVHVDALVQVVLENGDFLRSKSANKPKQENDAADLAQLLDLRREELVLRLERALALSSGSTFLLQLLHNMPRTLSV